MDASGCGFAGVDSNRNHRSSHYRQTYWRLPMKWDRERGNYWASSGLMYVATEPERWSAGRSHGACRASRVGGVVEWTAPRHQSGVPV